MENDLTITKMIKLIEIVKKELFHFSFELDGLN